MAFRIKLFDRLLRSRKAGRPAEVGRSDAERAAARRYWDAKVADDEAKRSGTQKRS